MTNRPNLEIKLCLMIAKDMVISPVLIYGIVPILMIASVFNDFEFLNNYGGMTLYTQTLPTNSKNKWAFDVHFFYQLLVLGLVLIKVFLMDFNQRIKIISKSVVQSTINENNGGYPYTDPLKSSLFFLVLVCLFIFFPLVDEYSPYERNTFAKDGFYITNFILFWFKTGLVIVFLMEFAKKWQEKEFI